MDFKFTEEQLMIRDTAEAFLSDVSTSTAIRQAMETQLGYDPELWQRICNDMYWQALLIPEEYGGMGLGYVELIALVEQMGRYLLCSPFFSTVCMAVPALMIAGSDEQKAAYLPQIIAGRTASVAYTGLGGGWGADAVEATWHREGKDFVLNGTWRYIPDGHSADFIVIAARAEGTSGEEGISLFLLDTGLPGVTRQWLPTMDQTRKQGQLVLDRLSLDEALLMGTAGQGWPSLSKIISLATVAAAAEQVGGAQQVLDMTVEYTQERVQFGRTIASYQAVKHKAADMMLKVEAGRSGLYYAACIATEALSGTRLGEELGEAASIVKSWCSDAYFFNAGCGIQLHGGVGFTWEYDIQLYFKRAKSLETFLGTSAGHREKVAALLLD